MNAIVKTQKRGCRNEVIRKKGNLKSVRELAKAYEVAKESKVTKAQFALKQGLTKSIK